MSDLSCTPRPPGPPGPAGPAGLPRLVDRRPDPPAGDLVAALVPPPRFADVRFSTYLPTHATQEAARDALADHAEEVVAGRRRTRRRWSRRAAPPPGCWYLDGGFGVGKTHLLASTWHAVDEAGVRAVYATFGQMTALVGALRLDGLVAGLAGARLVCVDEFELDDPADTRLIARLLATLVEDGTSVVTTSNTLPGELGRGRFDADRFRREIETLAGAFTTLSLDGQDYRRRGEMAPPPPMEADAVRDAAASAAEDGRTVTWDDFPAVLAHLAALHPARYRALVDGLDLVAWTGVAPVTGLPDGLRLARLVDALYDAQVAVALSGTAVGDLFAFDARGWAKVVGRARSRLGALQGEAARATPGGPPGPGVAHGPVSGG